MHKNNSSLYKSCLGVFREARNASGLTAGVWGEASGGSENFGVIPPLTSGAGIFGTDEGGPAPSFSGIYGGYIYDDLYVDGQVITTCGFYNTSDMRLKENVTLMRDKEEAEGASALDNLQRLEVLEYNLKRPSQIRSEEEGDNREMTEKAKSLARKRHFGISAQELQSVYPQLIEESQEGYLMVNYVELVPVLIRSIQELKVELDELKGKDAADDTGAAPVPARSRGSQHGTAAIDGTPSKTHAVLYQNTPNPFALQTEIRFSLPDNAPQAFIYIFDMQGKMQKQIPVDTSQQSVTINGYELSAGIYLYSLVVGGQEIDTKRMILSK